MVINNNADAFVPKNPEDGDNEANNQPEKVEAVDAGEMARQKLDGDLHGGLMGLEEEIQAGLDQETIKEAELTLGVNGESNDTQRSEAEVNRLVESSDELKDGIGNRSADTEKAQGLAQKISQRFFGDGSPLDGATFKHVEPAEVVAELESENPSFKRFNPGQFE